MSADPLAVHSLGADLNLYAYVSGAVLKNVDPLGLQDDAVDLTNPASRDIAAVEALYDEGDATYTFLEADFIPGEAPQGSFEPREYSEDRGIASAEGIHDAVVGAPAQALRETGEVLNALGYWVDARPGDALIEAANVADEGLEYGRPAEGDLALAYDEQQMGVAAFSTLATATAPFVVKTPSLNLNFSEARTGSISVGYTKGHNKVGISLPDSDTQWFHMTVGTEKSPPLVTSTGQFDVATAPHSGYRVATVPVTEQQAQAALRQALKLEAKGEQWYVMGWNDCASSTRCVMRAADISVGPLTKTPKATFDAAKKAAE